MVVGGLLFCGAFSSAHAYWTRTAFSLNLGVQTNLSSDDSFDNAWFSLDARLGLAVGRSLELSPEVMAVVDDSLDFDAVWLYPGAMLNIELGDFFIGAGAVLPILFFEGESESFNLAPKFNIGYRARNIMLTAYIFTWTEKGYGFLKYNQIGATIGFLF